MKEESFQSFRFFLLLQNIHEGCQITLGGMNFLKVLQNFTKFRKHSIKTLLNFNLFWLFAPKQHQQYEISLKQPKKFPINLEFSQKSKIHLNLAKNRNQQQLFLLFRHRYLLRTLFPMSLENRRIKRDLLNCRIHLKQMMKF